MFNRDQIKNRFGTTPQTHAFTMGWHRSHMRNSKTETGGVCASSRRQLNKAIKAKTENEFSVGWVLQEFFSLLTGTNPALPQEKPTKPKSILFARMFDRAGITPATAALQSELRHGQCLVDDVYHNVGWYNREGVKIGWGDLSTLHCEILHTYLPVGEVIFILSERDSSWEVPKGLNLEEPGIEYVVEKARAVITPQGLVTIQTQEYPSDDSPVDCKFITAKRTVHCFSAPRAWVKTFVEFLNT